jgi:FkbM family methyltransferase
MRMLNKCLEIIRRYKNWPEIIIGKYRKKAVTEVLLRNGTKLNSPDNGDLLHLIDEIFCKQVYLGGYLSISENDIVLDIGANIGVFSIFAARQTNNRVYSFEPFPDNCNYIDKNILNNGISNVTVEQVAVCNKVGVEKLYIGDIRGGNLLFDHNISGKLKRFIEVPCITLRHIFDKYGLKTVDFLKIDCEGSEGYIFASTPVEYLNRIKKIAIEFHDNVSILNHAEIEIILNESGFCTKTVWDGMSPFGYLYATR